MTQKRPRLATAAVVGEGKLRELAERTGGSGVVPSGAPRAKARGAAREPEAPEDAPEPLQPEQVCLPSG